MDDVQSGANFKRFFGLLAVAALAFVGVFTIASEIADLIPAVKPFIGLVAVPLGVLLIGPFVLIPAKAALNRRDE